jgi:hypothetical protein
MLSSSQLTGQENKAELTRLIANLLQAAGEFSQFEMVCRIGHQEIELQKKFVQLMSLYVCVHSNDDVNCSVPCQLLFGPRCPVLCLVLARDSFPDKEYPPVLMTVFPVNPKMLPAPPQNNKIPFSHQKGLFASFPSLGGIINGHPPFSFFVEKLTP